MSEKDTGLDIILPVHGRLELTRTAIDAIYAYTKSPFHLIVMDDSDASIREGSFHQVDPTDTTSNYFEKLCKIRNNITYFNSPTPFKTGNEFFNLGFKMCKYDFAATIMNSIRVEPEWEIAALDIMRTRPNVGIIGFKNLFPTGIIESAGIEFQGHVPTDFGRDKPGHWYNGIREVQAAQWAFALLRLKAVEGVIEDIWEGFVGWDDIANCFAVRAKGWKILYCGLGAGYHTPRATRGDDRKEAHNKNLKNAELFFHKYGYWDKYQEYKRSTNKMDVSSKLSPETKGRLSSKVLEFQVLTRLAEEHRQLLQGFGKQALEEAKISPEDYDIEVDPQNNVFNVRMKPDKVVPPVSLPENSKPETVPPAGDTKTDVPIDEKATAQEVKV